ncbi:hypothetical protein F5I97DRAFT_1160168 [Phlebopus sp. FC_14]|nr:hypothetical protein F5I97DRAFT_1160168 [Phlebopus sp. FC_14]
MRFRRLYLPFTSPLVVTSWYGPSQTIASSTDSRSPTDFSPCQPPDDGSQSQPHKSQTVSQCVTYLVSAPQGIKDILTVHFVRLCCQPSPDAAIDTPIHPAVYEMSSKSTTFVVTSMSTKRYAPKPMPIKKSRTTKLAATSSACLPDRLPPAPKLELKPLVLVHKLRTGQLMGPSRPCDAPVRAEDVRINASTHGKSVSKFSAPGKLARVSTKKQTIPKQNQTITTARRATSSAALVQSRPSRIPRISRDALAGVTGRSHVTVRQVMPVPGSRIPLPVRQQSPAPRNIENNCPIDQENVQSSSEKVRVDSESPNFNTSRPAIRVSAPTDVLEPTYSQLQESNTRVDVVSISSSSSPVPLLSICTSASVPEPAETSTQLPPQGTNVCRCPMVSDLELSPTSTTTSPTTSDFSLNGSSPLSDVSTPPSVSWGNTSLRAFPESPISSLAKVLVNSERIRKLYIPPLADDAKVSRNPVTQMEIDALRAQRKVAGGSAASVPAVERLGSLSGIAIVSKLRAQWEGRR